jgi:prevent-host-death family protein
VTTVGIAEAQANLAELLDRAERGEEVVIARQGKPAAKIVVVAEARVDRSGFLGCMKGQIWMADDFNAPLPPGLQAYFEGKIDDFTDTPIRNDKARPDR